MPETEKELEALVESLADSTLIPWEKIGKLELSKDGMAQKKCPDIAKPPYGNDSTYPKPDEDEIKKKNETELKALNDKIVALSEAIKTKDIEIVNVKKENEQIAILKEEMKKLSEIEPLKVKLAESEKIVAELNIKIKELSEKSDVLKVENEKVMKINADLNAPAKKSVEIASEPKKQVNLSELSFGELICGSVKLGEIQ